MPGHAIRITLRIVICVCGLGSLLTAVPYTLLRGVDLPVESEWAIFVAVLALLGVFCVSASLMPRRWIAELCKKDRNDGRLVSVPLRLLGGFAATGYLIAVFAQFASRAWNLNPQVMLALCPMYLVRMTIDPSPLEIFFLLAPMNAAVYGSLGVVIGYARLALRRDTR